MASVFYLAGMSGLANGGIDFDTDTIKVALVMTNTTCDTEDGTISYVDGFTTLDEMDGANYARKTLTNAAVNIDAGNSRVELDGDDLTWTSLGAGTRDIQGALIYKEVTNDTDSPPICFVDFTSDVTADGSDFTIPWNAEGIAQHAQA